MYESWLILWSKNCVSIELVSMSVDLCIGYFQLVHGFHVPSVPVGLGHCEAQKRMIELLLHFVLVFCGCLRLVSGVSRSLFIQRGFFFITFNSSQFQQYPFPHTFRIGVVKAPDLYSGPWGFPTPIPCLCN
jgi:hypothetical protein